MNKNKTTMTKANRKKLDVMKACLLRVIKAHNRAYLSGLRQIFPSVTTVFFLRAVVELRAEKLIRVKPQKTFNKGVQSKGENICWINQKKINSLYKQTKFPFYE